jgi:mono/diheme cytochrome c family protein
MLASKYLTAAGDTYRDKPGVTTNDQGAVAVGAYPDGAMFVGDAERGRQVYTRACTQCHGTTIVPLAGHALIQEVSDFYQILADGKVQPNQPYMPEFTLQRLSRQQSADIQAYLQQLGK